jgi:predicted transcriptional regulator
MDVLQAQPNFLALTTQIVSAYLAKNAVPVAEVTALIERTHRALTGLTAAGQAKAAAAAMPVPAVPVKKSVFPDFIVCLEDGKKLKMLKRHLATSYSMTPEQYRDKGHLPKDYPMVAANYAERRSALAKQIGLGRKPAAVPVPEPVTAPPVAKRRGKAAQRAAV